MKRPPAGVDELSNEKLAQLLRLKYHDSISDALRDLGDASAVRQNFAGFQKYLYSQEAA